MYLDRGFYQNFKAVIYKNKTPTILYPNLILEVFEVNSFGNTKNKCKGDTHHVPV